ncbi:MAG: CoA transferase [Dehalococcoidia bacterium]|nr:CoA transferase [Dehalococcoidia bacterium]
MPGPLADLTILDLTEYIAGPYATKLLADYGANVIKLERPGGDPSRGLGPFKGNSKHAERSGTFFYFNTNKRSLVLDLRAPEGRQVFLRLLDGADIVVESFRPGVLDRLGVGWDAVHARKPSAPLVSITNFGQTGPYREFRASELVLFGFAGEMYSMGGQDRAPVKMYGTAAQVESGSAAASAILGAAMVGKWQGVGQRVDFSLAESHLLGVDRRHATVIGYQFSGRKTQRRAGAGVALGGVYPCADGYVELAGGAWFDRVIEMLGNPAWLRDPKWLDPVAQTDPALIEEFEGHFYEWLLARTRREVLREALQARAICAPMFTVDELFDDPHFIARGLWARAEHAELGAFAIPGRPFLMSDSPWELRRPAPLLGQHTAEVLREAGYSEGEVQALAQRHIVEVR